MTETIDKRAMEEAREPIGYMERTRKYYRALGYSNDYKWAVNEDVAFASLKKPLSESKIAVITTTSPPGGPKDGNPRLKRVWSGDMMAAPSDLFTEMLAWDKEATHTKDRESYLPVQALQHALAEGRVGALARRFHGVPTTYSHRDTHERDTPEIMRRCHEDGVEVVLLAPM